MLLLYPGELYRLLGASSFSDSPNAVNKEKIDCPFNHVYTGSTVNIIIISNYLLQPSISN